jgi:hypothetical protein
MRKTLALAAALALLLCACGSPAAPGGTTTAPEDTSATETAATTEKATAVFAPAEGETNGFAWRTLDLDGEANAGINAWIENELAKEPEPYEEPREHSMGNGITIYKRGEYPDKRELVMKDAKTGKETVLLKDRFVGSGDIPLDDELYWETPLFDVALNERYFLYCWYGWEWPGGWGVLDIQKPAEHPIDFGDMMLHYSMRRGDSFYWEDSGDDGPYAGPLHLCKSDLTRLPSLRLVDLLADIPHEDADYVYETLLSPGERYYIVTDVTGLFVFDLHRQCVLRLYKDALGFALREGWTHAYLEHILLRDEHTLYWFTNNHNFENIMVEITLP